MKKLGLSSVFMLFAMTSFASLLPLEQLLGVNVSEEGITFQVKSNGCTQGSDFEIVVEEILEPMGPNIPAFEHHHYISVKRQFSDACELFLPYGTTIFFSFEQLGIPYGKFHINNPIGGDKVTFVP